MRILEDPLYDESRAFFSRIVESVPFSAVLKRSLAHNAAEFCLNSCIVEIGRPSRIDPDCIRSGFAEISPDGILAELSHLISAQASSFVDFFVENAVEPTASEFGVPPRDLEVGPMPVDDRRFAGRLAHRTYVTLTEFAKKHGIAVADLDPEGVDLVRYDLWLNWVRRLPGHEVFYPNLVKDVASLPLSGAHDLESEQYDFDSFRTAILPFDSDPFDDLEISDWDPLHRALARSCEVEQRIYISVDDGFEASALPLVLKTYPLTAMVGRESLISGFPPMLTQEEGIQRFREETTPPPVSHVALRAGRALLKLRHGFVWKQIGARYRLKTEPGKFGERIQALSGTPLVVVTRWRHLDASAETCLDVPLRDIPGRIGVLVDESSVYGWRNLLRSLAEAGYRTELHTVILGPNNAFRVIAGFTIRDGFRFFLYGATTLSLFAKLRDLVLSPQGSELACDWLGGIDEKERGLRMDLALACEHLIQRGY
jgi:hypothetical protein